MGLDDRQLELFDPFWVNAIRGEIAIQQEEASVVITQRCLFFKTSGNIYRPTAISFVHVDTIAAGFDAIYLDEVIQEHAVPLALSTY